MKVAIVFMGPMKNGGFGEQVKFSLGKTLELYQELKFDKILCVGGSGMKFKDGSSKEEKIEHHSGAEAMRKFLVSKGIPEDVVFASGWSMNTIHNVATDFWAWFIKNFPDFFFSVSDDEFYFISSRPHLPRIKCTLEVLMYRSLKEKAKSLKSRYAKPIVSKKLGPRFHFVDCGYKEPKMEWLKDAIMYFLTLYDPLGERWPWTWLLARRKASRLATGR